ncbi:General stress protein [Minicystis rosea]|nr:General stress protein [Minicystis rosea]
MNNDLRHDLIDMLQKFDNLIVVNAGLDGLPHGRPMAVAEVMPTGEIWFVTSRASAIASEVRTFTDAHAVATGQREGSYVSVTGRLTLVDDRERVKRLWRETWLVWFPDGVNDPNLLLMCMHPEIGSYWNVAPPSPIRRTIESAAREEQAISEAQLQHA